MTGQIVAMGGGGFSMEPENPRLDDFVLSLSARQPARVCFIPTASGDAAPYIARFYRSFSGRALPTDLTLFGSSSLPRQPADGAALADFIAAQDIFYVGGGNTANLLALWRAHGLDRLLHQAWQAGAILCGVSAGMLCWFEGGVTDSFGQLAALKDGLGWLPGTACPHYDGEAQRRPTYHQLVAGGLSPGYAADDGAALHFVGTTLAGCVSSRRDAGAYRVELEQGRVVERRLSVHFLDSA